MTKNGGSHPDFIGLDSDEDIPTDVHVLKGMIVAARGQVNRIDSRLTIIEKDITELNTTMRGGVLAVKIVGAIIGAAAIAGPALSWALQHISLR